MTLYGVQRDSRRARAGRGRRGLDLHTGAVWPTRGRAARVCDGQNQSTLEAETNAPLPLQRLFGAFHHASKNSCIGVRRTLGYASDPKLHFTRSQYENTAATPAIRYQTHSNPILPASRTLTMGAGVLFKYKDYWLGRRG
jgi:hypothetical protein